MSHLFNINFQQESNNSLYTTLGVTSLNLQFWHAPATLLSVFFLTRLILSQFYVFLLQLRLTWNLWSSCLSLKDVVNTHSHTGCHWLYDGSRPIVLKNSSIQLENVLSLRPSKCFLMVSYPSNLLSL